MPIELDRILRAAAEAVLESPDSRQSTSKTKRKRLTAPRAVLLGAGVYTAGRLLVRSRGLVENLQERLVEFESRLGAEQEDEPEDEFEDEDEFAEEEDEEPEDEFDDEGPEDEEPEEDDEEPEPRTSSAAGRHNGRQ